MKPVVWRYSIHLRKFRLILFFATVNVAIFFSFRISFLLQHSSFNRHSINVAVPYNISSFLNFPEQQNVHYLLQKKPLLFPIFSEQFSPAPRNELSKLVYLAYPRNQSVLLFTQGLNESDVKFCVQNNLKSKVLWMKNSALMGDCCVVVVDCAWNSLWTTGKVISVGNNKTRIFSSTAYLHTELMYSSDGPRYTLCAMTQVKDASKFVPDWVKYHRRIGIDHFYIFDNNSSEAYSQDPDVEYISFPWRKSQFQALMYGVQMTKSRCQWLAVFDVDEFIYPQKSQSLISIITSFNRSDVGEMKFRISKMTSTPAGLHDCPQSSVPEGYLQRQNSTPELESPKCISWSRGLYAHGIHSGIFAKHHKKKRSVAVPSDTAYIVHYKVQCWPDFYVSKYRSGRNGLVRDWVDNGLKQHVVPRGWSARHTAGYTVRDTSFRDYFLEVVARPLPEPSLVP